MLSASEFIAIKLTMAKRTDFVDRPAPVYGLSTQGCDPDHLQEQAYLRSQFFKPW